MKNKTIAAWLALIGGPLGLHRFYLRGMGDLLGWLLPIPTALGLYGIERVQQNGLDDQLSWVLIPLLGFTVAGCALNAIVYGLMTPEKWNARFNPSAPLDGAPGRTHWFTIGAIVLALLLGTTVLISSIVFSFQRYFESTVTGQASARLSRISSILTMPMGTVLALDNSCLKQAQNRRPPTDNQMRQPEFEWPGI